MGERLLLINPSKPPSKRRRAATKKRRKPMARKRARTAAQKAATRKLVALNRRRAKGTSTAKRKPIRRRRRNPSMAPAKRRAYRATRTAAMPVRRRRRNPVRRRGLQGVLNRVVMPAAVATGGAIALDLAWAQMTFLPVQWQTGNLKYLAKGTGAVLMGMLVERIPGVKKHTADAMAMGALTTVFYQLARQMIAQNAPTLKLDGMGLYVGDQGNMGYYNPAVPTGGYNNNDMGLYVGDANSAESNYYGGM